jgi:uncharacterized protein (DUF58 family)
MDVIALALIFAIILVTQMALLCGYCFHKLNYKCEFSVKEAHEGDSLYLVETVYNGKLLPVPWLKVDIHSSRWLDFAGTCSVIAQDDRRVTSSYTLRSYQRTTRKWKLKCMKRGVFTTENVTLVSGDLLNFRIVSIPAAVNAQLMVYPEIIDLDELFTPVNLQQSDKTVNRWIVDDPFMISGIREYTPGDPLNRIHWPATARTGRLMVKKNDFTSQRSLTVLLNMQSQLYEYADTINKKNVELGIKASATLLDRALKEGTPVRLGTNGCTSADARKEIFTGEAADKEHVLELFKILARLMMKNVMDFEKMLDEVLPVLENTEVVIITAYMSKRLCEQSDQLVLAGNMVSIILLDTVFEGDVRPEMAELYIMAGNKGFDEREGALAT